MVKKINLKDIKLSFTIVNFEGFKNISVSNFRELHFDFISLVQKSNLMDNGICNISGKEESIVTLHRSIGGPFGKAKLISKSDGNKFAYQGDRFSINKDDVDIIKIGYETSEKIHLMIKYLLENKNSSTWLGSSQYLINWFSDDLANENQIDVTHLEFDDWFYDEDESENISFIAPNQENKQIGSSFIKGRKQFGDDSLYNIAILNKTSNGRIALKYFRQLQTSELLRNLEAWQKNYSWSERNKDGIYKIKTPSMNDIINVAYGLDRERYLELDNDSFRSDQYQQLVTALIDGHTLPNSIVKKLENNIKQRQKYPKQWYKVQQVTLAVLHKQYGREFTPMIDHTETDRSYLFGRLLAIYELIEAQRYVIDGGSQDRITNAERYWNAYTSQPAKMMVHLDNKVKPYEEVLKRNSPGTWHKLEKERQEVIQLLSPIYTNKDFSQPLDYKFIFGYYAEKQFYYTKQVKGNEE